MVVVVVVETTAAAAEEEATVVVVAAAAAAAAAAAEAEAVVVVVEVVEAATAVEVVVAVNGQSLPVPDQRHRMQHTHSKFCPRLDFLSILSSSSIAFTSLFSSVDLRLSGPRDSLNQLVFILSRNEIS